MTARGIISLKLLIQIFFFMALFFVAFKIMGWFFGFWLSKPVPGTINSAERIQIEIDNMVRDEVGIPMFIDKNHQINGFASGDRIRLCGTGTSCICICNFESNCQENTLKKCFILDAKLEKDFLCLPSLTDKGDATSFEAQLKKENEKVSVVC